MALLYQIASYLVLYIPFHASICLMLSTFSALFLGMPDLTLRFSNPRVIDDVSFHPCVR